MLGSRAARGAVGRMERSIGGARYTSSSLLCQVVETKGRNLANHPKKHPTRDRLLPRPSASPHGATSGVTTEELHVKALTFIWPICSTQQERSCPKGTGSPQGETGAGQTARESSHLVWPPV